MTALLPFFLNTMMLRAADPGNDRFFLPKVLGDLPGDNSQGKLLPIQEDFWDLGTVGQPAGTTITDGFKLNWGQYLERVEERDMRSQKVIADPSNPDPSISLGNGKNSVVVTGLGNVSIIGAPTYTDVADGYDVALVLQFDTWDGQEGRPKFPGLGISAPYRLNQDMCLADKDTPDVCNGQASTKISGTGTIELQMHGAFLDLVVRVTAKRVGGAFQGMDLDIRSLNLRGAAAGVDPIVEMGQITINADVSDYLLSVWKGFVTSAITHPETMQTIVNNINVAINDPATRASVSAEATKNTANVVNGLFAPLTGAMAPSQPGPGVNPVDRYLFDRTRYALNNPASNLFLPGVLAQSDAPSLSPLDVARIDLPDLPISSFLVFVKNVLTGLHVLGLTNVKAAEPDLDMQGNKMHFRGTLGAWNPPPAIGGGKSIKAPPATGTAAFSLTAKADNSVIGGTIDLTVVNVMLSGVVEAFGDSDGDLQLDITQLEFTSAKLSESIKVNVKVDGGGFLQDPVNGAANSDQTLGDILGAINAQIAADLPGISRDVTQYAKDAIASQLK